jgi:hypothetical protein
MDMDAPGKIYVSSLILWVKPTQKEHLAGVLCNLGSLPNQVKRLPNINTPAYFAPHKVTKKKFNNTDTRTGKKAV